MSENELITETSLPTYVEYFDEKYLSNYSSLLAKIPIITLLSTNECSNKMNSTELRLRRWFKCTQFESKCFATRNTCQQFLSHLTDKHFGQQLFCLYCHQINDENKVHYKHEDLIEHIRETHPYRQYQCNLCLYRSISIDHLFIHQMSNHSRNFEATVNQTIELNNTLKECKILECTQLAEREKPDLIYYYNNYKNKRINEGLTSKQCLYCEYSDTNKDELYAHCVAAHPDYPILIYTGINSGNDDNSDTDCENDNSEPVINSRKRTFDDVSTNGVVDTYEFDVWTESEDEDVANMLTEDDLSSEGEPELKRSRSEDSDTEIETRKPGTSRITRLTDNSILHLRQTKLCIAVCVSALIAYYITLMLSR